MNNEDASRLLSRLFNWLDDSRIAYCVERNYQGYPEKLTGDIDLLVDDQDMDRAAKGLADLAAQFGWRCYLQHVWKKYAFLGLIKEASPNRFTLTIELFAGARWHGLQYLSASNILSKRLQCGVTWRPDPSHQVIITTIHHLLYNRLVPEKYHEEVLELSRGNLESIENALSAPFGNALARRIARSIRDQEWDVLKEEVQTMQRMLLFRQLLRHPFETIGTIFYGLLAKHRLPQGVLISVGSNDEDERRLFSESLLEMADRWHIFLPPLRGVVRPSDSAKSTIERIVRRGGVAIVNGGMDQEFQARLNLPVFRLRLEEGQWTLDASGSLSTRQVIKQGTVGDMEATTRDIWEKILCYRALELDG